jgi:hypothetical protein
LLVAGQPRTFAEDQVGRVQQRRFDSLWNGLLIGAGVAAAAGLAYVTYWWIADPNECDGPCMEDMLFPTVMGTLVGLGIDAAIKTNVTLYDVSASTHDNSRLTSSLSSGLRLARARGVVTNVTLRFRF